MPGARPAMSVPQPAGPQGQLQFGPGGPPAHPHQPEIAHRGPAGPGVGLEVDDLPAALACLQGMHGADDPAAHDHHTFRAHPTSIVVIPWREGPAGHRIGGGARQEPASHLARVG